MVRSFFTIVGWTATVLGLLAGGYVSGAAAAYALIGVVVVVAIADALNLSIAKVVVGVALPVFRSRNSHRP